MKKVKDYIKKNPEPAKGRFGVDPHDPWSAKYNMAEDLTTKQKGAGDSRSKIAHSPTQQRASELDKAAKFYQVKNPTGTMGSKVHHEDTSAKNKKDPETKAWDNRYLLKQLLTYLGLTKMKEDVSHEKKILSKVVKKEGNQNTALTPESIQKCNESPAGKMCEIHGMKACKTMNEAKKKKMSPLEKWRQGFSDREKAHKEFMKSIEHLPHQQQMQKLMDKIKANRASVHNEETYMDAKAATPAVMSPGEGISEKKTTLQRVMALKKKKLKEDMYDHEKEDKSVATYGKKPKFEKAEKDEGGEKKPQAAAVMTGGTTLTGSKRDTIEIDPMMRNRPGQPDVTKKDDKKDGKDKDKKKDK